MLPPPCHQLNMIHLSIIIRLKIPWKGRGTRDQIASIHWIIEKAKEFQKNIYLCFIDYAKAFVWIITNCGKLLKRWEHQTVLTVSWETFMWVKKRQLEPCMEQLIGSRWCHWCNGHKLGQISGDGEGQGSLACCSPWGCKESDTTGWLNNNDQWLGSVLSLPRVWIPSLVRELKSRKLCLEAKKVPLSFPLPFLLLFFF